MSSQLKYIDGWLKVKEKGQRKYEERWFVLKAELSGGILGATRLFCFKDQNTHVHDHLIGAYQIRWPLDSIVLLKKDGSKPGKCDFALKIGERKFLFRADDDISRERWIYALCDLVGQGVIQPSELPSESNNIRSRFSGAVHAVADHTQLPARLSQVSISAPIPCPVRQDAPRPPPESRRPKLERRAHTFDCTGGSHRSSGQHERAFRWSRGSDELEQPFLSDGGGEYIGLRSDGLMNLRWYCPGLLRMEAEALLSSSPVGTYLLRDCESNPLPGFYTLTYKDSAKLCHHMIRPDDSGKGFRFDSSETLKVFPNPVAAVDFYMKAKTTLTFVPVPFTKDVHRGDGDGLVSYSSAKPVEANPYLPAPVPFAPAPSGLVPHRPVLSDYGSVSKVSSPPLPRSTSMDSGYLQASEIANEPEPDYGPVWKPPLQLSRQASPNDFKSATKSPLSPRISPAGATLPAPERLHYQLNGLPPIHTVSDEQCDPSPYHNVAQLPPLHEGQSFEGGPGSLFYGGEVPDRVPPRAIRPVLREKDDLYINAAPIEREPVLREAPEPPPPPLLPRAHRRSLVRQQPDGTYINIDEHRSMVATTDVIAETVESRRARRAPDIRARSVQDEWL